jgi:transcriptional regulator with XRE-family HTH domain
MAKYTHDDVMSILKSVPGVTEHLNKPSVIMGKQIAKRRIEMGLTQTKLVEVAREKGITLTQATVSKAEAGHEGVTQGTLNKIVITLGELEDLQLNFKEHPKSLMTV